MNKPPERIRVIFDSSGTIWNCNSRDSINDLNRFALGAAPFTEHFYTLEKPMTQKTENLTEKEAWIAMANGECVKALRKDYRVYKGELLEWSITLGTWMGVTTMGVGPYSIVPDPSKPKEVEDEYFKDWSEVYSAYEDDGSEVCPMRRLRRLIETHFEKRKP